MTGGFKLVGSTFNYREVIKERGGRWDADERAWIFHSDAHKAFFSRMVGVQLVPLTDDVVKLIGEDTTPKRNIFEELFEIIGSVDDGERYDDPKPINRQGTTNLHGDDPTYYNKFADKNPICHFGFSSLNEMSKFVQAIPERYRRNSLSRGVGWRTSDAEWSGSQNMDAALMLARDGWPEGVNMAEKINELINSENPTIRERRYSVAGGQVNVARMLSGNPMHMKRRPKQEGTKNITLFVEAFASAVITPQQMIVRAACIAALCDVIESHGYSCEIVSVATAVTGRNPAYHLTCTVKHAGEKLNLNDTVFALGHPSYFRRMVFGCIASDDALERTWFGMGSPTSAFNEYHPTEKNQFYIRQLHFNNRNDVKNGNVLQMAKQMFPQILPKNLPIEVKI